MTPAEARDFLRTNHRAVLATYRLDGRPQLTPVGATVDAEGRVIVSTREPSMKVRNLRRDPRISLLVLGENWYGPVAQVEGTAEVVDGSDGSDVLELLVDYYRRMSGEHPDWEEYRQAMRDERRVLLRFDIERAGPSSPG